MVSFSTRISDCDSHNTALLELFISSNLRIFSIVAFLLFGHLNHVVISVPIDFFRNLKGNTLFHCRAYDYCCPDWDSLQVYMRDVPLKDVFNIDASVAVMNFVSGFRLELMHISFIINIRSSLIYLYGF